MIISFSVENFFSIKDKQEIFFNVTDKDAVDDRTFNTGETHLNLINYICGANGSGKTNILKAISFITNFVAHAYQMANADLFEVQAFGDNTHNSKFEIVFKDKEYIFQYQIDLNCKDQDLFIEREYLGIHRERSFRRVYEINRSDHDDGKLNHKTGDISSFCKIIKKINPEDKKRYQEISDKPILSAMIGNGYYNGSFFDHNKIWSNIAFRSTSLTLGIHHTQIIAMLHRLKSPELREGFLDQLSSFCQQADLTISKFYIPGGSKKLMCVHESSGSSLEVPFEMESEGTKKMLGLWAEIMEILTTGGVCIIDELDSHLHPEIVEYVISLFCNRKTNPGAGQLFFTSHQYQHLNLCQKTQIFICNKDKKNFDTVINRLDEYDGVRNTDDYFKKYISGHYDGIPNIEPIIS